MRGASSFMEFWENFISPAPTLYPGTFPTVGSLAVTTWVLLFNLHNFLLSLPGNFCCWLLPRPLPGSVNWSCPSNTFPSVSALMLWVQWGRTPQPTPSHAGCHLHSASLPLDLVCLANAKANTTEAPRNTDMDTDTSPAMCSTAVPLWPLLGLGDCQPPSETCWVWCCCCSSHTYLSSGPAPERDIMQLTSPHPDLLSVLLPPPTSTFCPISSSAFSSPQG